MFPGGMNEELELEPPPLSTREQHFAHRLARPLAVALLVGG